MFRYLGIGASLLALICGAVATLLAPLQLFITEPLGHVLLLFPVVGALIAMDSLIRRKASANRDTIAMAAMSGAAASHAHADHLPAALEAGLTIAAVAAVVSVAVIVRQKRVR